MGPYPEPAQDLIKICFTIILPFKLYQSGHIFFFANIFRPQFLGNFHVIDASWNIKSEFKG
jgi:hypothetical protein